MADLQNVTPEGHEPTLYRAVGVGWYPTCRCGWIGTEMRGPKAHSAAMEQYRSHLKGLKA